MGKRDPIVMKKWSARNTKIYSANGAQVVSMHAEITKYFYEEGEEAAIIAKGITPNEERHWFELDLRFYPPKQNNAVLKFTIVLDHDNDEVIKTPIEDFIQFARTHLAMKHAIDIRVNPKSIYNKREVLKEWVIPSAIVETNVGKQVTDLHCHLEKLYFDKDEITLFERKVLGYRMYKHIIHVTPVNPIRENRDKDYLPPYSEEGNDAIFSFTLQVEDRLNGDEPNLQTYALSKKVLERLNDFKPKKPVKGKRKYPWWNRTLYKKYFKDEKFSIWTAIYPFHGNPLSGWTDILSFQVENDDDGVSFTLGILGFHFSYSSQALRKFLHKCFIRNRPYWERGMDWSTYYPILKKWQKEHRFEYFFDAQWHFVIGIDRANGFHYRSEFDHSSGPRSWGKINPWRNKLWNLI